MANETKLYTPIAIAASKQGSRLFRNNVGTGYQLIARPPPGWKPPDFLAPFTYGLPSGSADLVGWSRVTITPDMVGQTLAVFASVEVKDPAWRSTPSFENSDRGKAQAAWLRTVREAGGIAGRAQSVDEALAILAPRT